MIEAISRREPVSQDPEALAGGPPTPGERLADRLATFGGSWRFILIFLGFLAVWVVLNAMILAPRHEAFDPYPFIFLNLFLSMLAALQAPVIMMSQNRQAARDRQAANHDYRVNLKAELEIRSLHEKLDELREGRWTDLVTMQRDQIRLLERLLDDAVPRDTRRLPDPRAPE
ncbi:MAG TPA: DUF1003 domain-containing protein [Gemmatimonadaceae bacterium]|nr:DUF1003 domain-containing protein [Gemmatimonadaceae bacterium]